MSSPVADSAASESQGLGLGTFLGVYTPTVLTILGVILYMRMGWVVGNAGVGGTIVIVLIAHVITTITALSLSSLSTNMKVGVGGAYYIISRSLGLELGGALGIPLFLSQVLSVTLYAFGLAEVGMIVSGYDPKEMMIWVQIIAALIIVAVTAPGRPEHGAGAQGAAADPVLHRGQPDRAAVGGGVGGGARAPLGGLHPGAVLGGVRRVLPSGDRGDGRPGAVRRSAGSRAQHPHRRAAGRGDGLHRLHLGAGGAGGSGPGR